MTHHGTLNPAVAAEFEGPLRSRTKLCQCVDCPAMFKKLGKKTRCSPCSDTHSVLQKRAYDLARKKNRLHRYPA